MFQIGEIVWGRMRGFPWWPARIITPTPDKLNHLSVSKIPPDHRLVSFFNDKDRYTLLSTKSLSPFSNPEISNQTKRKTGKGSNKLKLAFNQAIAENNSTTKLRPHRSTNSAQHPTQSLPNVSSKRSSTTDLPDAADTQSNLPPARSVSSNDRYSQQTTNHVSTANAAPKSNLLRLRIREPRSITNSRENQKSPISASHRRVENPELNSNNLRSTHLTSNPERTRRASKPSIKLRHNVAQKEEQPVKKRRRQASHVDVKRIKLESCNVQTPQTKIQPQRDIASGNGDFSLSRNQPLSEERPSVKTQQTRKVENPDRSKLSFQRSARVHRTSSRYHESNGGSAVVSEDEVERPVGSKRSRGVEAPRLSDGQRRLHIRQERKKDLRAGKQENEGLNVHAPQRATRFTAGKASSEAMELAARPFEALTKDQCVTIICGMQEALRCKNVRIWLQGCRLAKAEEVKKTEKDLIQACESGIAKAEELLAWARRHENIDSGTGTRFAKLEEKAIQGCVVLSDVYFDRRKVSLRNVGCRVLQLTKELPAYSRRLTSILEELLVLWVDLTSRS